MPHICPNHFWSILWHKNIQYLTQKCVQNGRKLVTKKLRKRTDVRRFLAIFQKSRKKMVTAETKWWQLWQAFLTGIKYRKTQYLCGFAALQWILLKTIHETEVSPMSPKWFKNGDTGKPVFTRVWGYLSPMSPLF